MESKLQFIKKCSDLTGREVKIPKRAQASPQKRGGKKGKDVDPKLQFTDSAALSRILHFYELGWDDPDLRKKIKGNEYAPAGPCPFPQHLDNLNLTKVSEDLDGYE